jgi:hypothetical protein
MIFINTLIRKIYGKIKILYFGKNNTEKYPPELLRGISCKDQLDEEGLASATLFPFDKKVREDGFIEESINWYDNEKAKNILFSQKKEDGNFQFKMGAAVLIKEEIDRIIKNSQVKDRLSYERNCLNGNKFHGNLLLKDGVPKLVKRKIAATIALNAVREIEKNPYL